MGTDEQDPVFPKLSDVYEAEVFKWLVGLLKLDFVDDRITAELFSLGPEEDDDGGGIERCTPVRFFQFAMPNSSGSAMKKLRRRGLRPATFKEMLAFGCEYPEFQRKFVIVAPASVVEIGGKRYVAALNGSILRGKGWRLVWRGLVLCPCDAPLDPTYRFLFCSH